MVAHHTNDRVCDEAIKPIPLWGETTRSSVGEGLVNLWGVVIHLGGERNWPVLSIAVEGWRDLDVDADSSICQGIEIEEVVFTIKL